MEVAALFVISGMGTAFAFRRRSWQQYIREREQDWAFHFSSESTFSGLVFLNLERKPRCCFTIFPGVDEMPYGHLWFIYNLLIYSVLLTPLFSHVRNNPDGLVLRLVRSILRVKWGLGILLLPPLILALNGILFKPWHFGEVGMWWEFPRYMIYFLFGFLLISARDEYFPALDSVRIPVTIITPILAILWFIMNESSTIPSVMEGGWVDRGYAAFSSLQQLPHFYNPFTHGFGVY